MHTKHFQRDIKIAPMYTQTSIYPFVGFPFSSESIKPERLRFKLKVKILICLVFALTKHGWKQSLYWHSRTGTVDTRLRAVLFLSYKVAGFIGILQQIQNVKNKEHRYSPTLRNVQKSTLRQLASNVPHL